MHAHNKKAPHTMGGWWAVHENGPYVKYRHYHKDRKRKKAHTHTHLRTLLTGTRSSVAHLNAPCGIAPWTERTNERNVLFNDALNTLRLYGVRHMVKDHSDSEKVYPLPPHRLLFPINSKGSFICTIPQTE